MSAALFDRFRSAKREREAEVDRDYRQLVADVFHGRGRDPADVIAVLEAAGRSVEDLEGECAWLEQRATKVAAAGKLLELREEKTRIHAAIEREEQKARDALAARDRAVAPLWERLRAIEPEEGAAQSARDWLIADANLPAGLKAKRDVLIARRAALGSERKQLLCDTRAADYPGLAAKVESNERKLAEMQDRGKNRAVTVAERDLGYLLTRDRAALAAMIARLPVVDRELSEVERAIEGIHREACAVG